MVQCRAARFLCRDYRREVGIKPLLRPDSAGQLCRYVGKPQDSSLLYKIIDEYVAVDTGHLLQTQVANTRSTTFIAFTNIFTSKTVINMPSSPE